MHFFDACHWERQGDRAKQRKALDAALEADATDVDVLIACYRLPHPSAAYHRRILDLIQKSAQQMREQIADSPDDSATLRNQIAWLIGNTEGDYDEAIKHSQISIEQSPDIGGYYDTLARCYYAKGDCENAVKNQTKAAEMEPHSGLIAGQLRLFQKAAAEQKAQNHRETHPDQRH
jgi:tetratricopeptide (TPR) repeat protein